MLIGYRAWIPVLDYNLKPVLQSFTTDYLWHTPVASGPPPVGESDFEERISRGSLEIDHSLGFFSFNHPKYLASMLYEDDMEDAISGLIQPFGLVRKFERGFRSQSAQVLALSTYTKCLLVECSAPASRWIVHKNNRRLSGLCCSHEDTIKFTWMKSFVGENPAIIANEALLTDLGNRYQCDIIEHSEMNNFKENYGSW